MFDEVVAYNLYGHVYHPTIGTVYKKRGICSGSVFTNLIDGISNLLLINYSFAILGKGYQHIYVCGDDNLISTNTVLDVRCLVHIWKQYFNMDIEYLPENISTKGMWGIQFLGSYWTRDGPERPIMRMILSACKQG